ncbi:uncharacterized protein DNG_02740 [Cephalotrichum gorgonifer]|uniref:Uncharacterized protein n=1 Tax=Cephalotrichum gorgonifer TaxID=2041049 RepID=A0AAE8MUQ1_9PEZI|nr:uncharacterized protein DNG_02740 [Cephalotrichum gorgonifer]
MVIRMAIQRLMLDLNHQLHPMDNQPASQAARRALHRRRRSPTSTSTIRLLRISTSILRHIIHPLRLTMITHPRKPTRSRSIHTPHLLPRVPLIRDILSTLVRLMPTHPREFLHTTTFLHQSPPTISGPGSLIRVLPPKPAVPSDRVPFRRKDRKSWKTKRNKGKPATPAAKASDDPTEKNVSGPNPEDTKGIEPEDCEDKDATNAHDVEKDKDEGQVDSDKTDVDSASKVTDKPEEGEIVDDDSEWAWDEKSIFKEPESVHFADAVAGPLPTEYTDHVLMPPAWDSKCITSKFVNPDNEIEFCRPKLGAAVLIRVPDESRSHGVTKMALYEIEEGQIIPRVRAGLQRSTGLSLLRDILNRVIGARERRRRRDDDSPRPGRGSPSSRTYFQLPLEERSREPSVESDLNSLENELLGLSPKSPSEDEKEKADNRKVEESKKRQSDNMIPKSKRRRVQMDSAFSRRW